MLKPTSIFIENKKDVFGCIGMDGIMAKQTGIIKLKGTIGGISFYKTSDGHLAREKGSVDKKRIQNIQNLPKVMAS
jgi:hypothetical protein